MNGALWTGCSVDVVRDESQEAYIFYVNCDGIPVELMRRKLGDLDTKRVDQQNQRAEQQAQQQSQQQQQ